jgi:hypothetical protein
MERVVRMAGRVTMGRGHAWPHFQVVWQSNATVNGGQDRVVSPSLSLKGMPRADAQAKARLEAAARSPSSKRRDYPQLAVK